MKLHIFTNFASSIDGKIATFERTHIPLASRYDHLLMAYHRSRADAVLHGASTIRVYPHPIKTKKKSFRIKRALQGLPTHPLNILVSESLDLDPNWPYFQDKDVKRLLVVPKTVAQDKLAPFEGLADVFFYSDRSRWAEDLVEDLRAKGYKSLLLEGGGATIFPFVEADLVDEWNLTLAPKVVGGKDAPTMVEGQGFTGDAIKTYRLKQVKRVKDELYLQYVRATM